MYSLKVVFGRISGRIIGNLITAVQIFIGICLVLFSLNVLIIIKSQNREFLDSAMDKIYTISIRNIPQTPSHYIISEEQLACVKALKGIHTAIYVEYNIVTFAGKTHLENGENITDKYIISFSDSVDEIYMEEEFEGVLTNFSVENTVNFDDINFNLIDNYNIFDDEMENVHSCVMPFDMYWTVAKPSSFAGFNLSIACENSDDVDGIFYLEEILSGSSEYEFYVGNEFYDFLEKATYAKSSSSRIALFSIIVLFVVFISTTCIFLFLIDERSFEIAVCRAVGASCKMVFFEFAAELFSVSLIPTLTSIFFLALISRNGFQFIGINIPSFQATPCIIAVFVILLADFICLIPIAKKIYRLKPYELLVSEG